MHAITTHYTLLLRKEKLDAKQTMTLSNVHIEVFRNCNRSKTTPPILQTKNDISYIVGIMFPPWDNYNQALSITLKPYI